MSRPESPWDGWHELETPIEASDCDEEHEAFEEWLSRLPHPWSDHYELGGQRNAMGTV